MVIEMTYATYIVISIVMTIWVARTLSKNGQVFLVDSLDGNVRVGIDAFGERWKARVVKSPIIHGLAHASYNIFARYLTRWNRSRGNW